MYESGIYKITAPNGHFYIGSTTRTFKRRWIEHKTELRHHKHSNPVLQSAWDKYGEENMIFEVIQRCPPEDCARLEQIVLETLKPAYNLSMDTVSPFKNRKHTESAKEKCRQIHLGKKKPPLSEEHRYKLGSSMRGKKRPPRNDEWKKNASNAQKKRWDNPTEKMLSRKHPCGYKNPHSEEHRKAISIAKIGTQVGDKNPAARSVKCIETGEIFSTVKNAAIWIRMTKNPNATPSNISSCATGNGNLKSAYGYHWEYADTK